MFQLLGDPFICDQRLVTVLDGDKGDKEGLGGSTRVNRLHALLVLFVTAVPCHSGDRPIDEFFFPEVGMGIEDPIGQERLQFTLEKLDINLGFNHGNELPVGV